MKGFVRENEVLKRELFEKEREFEELRKRLVLMDEMIMWVEKLGEKINVYEV